MSVKQLFVLQTTPSNRGCSGWDRDSTSRAPSPGSHTGTQLWDGAESPGHPWGDGSRGRVRGRRGHEQPGTVDYIHPDRCWQLEKGRTKVCVELSLLFLETWSKQRHSFRLRLIQQGCTRLHFQLPCRHLPPKPEWNVPGPGLGGHGVLSERFLYLWQCRDWTFAGALDAAIAEVASCLPRDKQPAGCQAELPGWLQGGIKSS